MIRSRLLALVVLISLALCAGHALAATPDLLVASQGNSQLLRYNGTTGAFINVFAQNPAMDGPTAITYGPDGNIYVASDFSGNITKFDSISGGYLGTFVASGNNGLTNPEALSFGPDGNLYVLTRSTAAPEAIWKFNGSTGAFISKFGTGGGNGDTDGMTFGPDGNLYQGRRTTETIMKFDGTSGGLLSTFGPDSGLDVMANIAFGPDGNIYVSNVSPGGVLRYNGTTGAFIDAPISSTIGTWGLKFSNDNKLYVGFTGTNEVRRYNATTLNPIDVFIPPNDGHLNGPFSFAFMPEPSALGILLVGSAGTFLRRRRSAGGR